MILGKLGVVIQARTASSRLPRKVMLKIGEHTVLDLVTKRLEGIGDTLVVATTTAPVDDEIVALCDQLGVPCFRGSEDDVLDRFIKAAQAHSLTRVIRVCSDNVFLQPQLVRQIIPAADDDCDYMSFTVDGRPAILTHSGFFVEFVTLRALEMAHSESHSRQDREHVTSFIYSNPDRFRIRYVEAPDAIARPEIRLTLDTLDDWQNVCAVAAYLDRNGLEWSYQNIVAFIDVNTGIQESMKSLIQRNRK